MSVTKHVKHSLKHHVPTSVGGFIVGVWVVKDVFVESVSAFTEDAETIQKCVEVIDSIFSFLN